MVKFAMDGFNAKLLKKTTTENYPIITSLSQGKGEAVSTKNRKLSEPGFFLNTFKNC